MLFASFNYRISQKLCVRMDGLQPKSTPPKHFSQQCIYSLSPLPLLQAKFIEKNKDTRKDRQIADLRIYIAQLLA
jgi:hypothetical protein